MGLLGSVEHAIRSFKKNEKALLRISATHAYGAQGNAEFNIPPNADLEYEVKLKTFEKVGLVSTHQMKSNLNSHNIVFYSFPTKQYRLYY